MKNALITDVTGILLAGGKSRRMGRDKRFLPVGEETLFARSLAALRSIFQRVLVVVAQDSPPIDTDAIVLRDLVPDCGSLGGLYTGLKEAGTDWVFAVACDMPFLDPATVRQFQRKLACGVERLHYCRACGGSDSRFSGPRYTLAAQARPSPRRPP